MKALFTWSDRMDGQKDGDHYPISVAKCLTGQLCDARFNYTQKL